MQQGTFSSQVFTFLLVSSILVLFALLISCLLLSTFFSLNSFILKVRFIHSVIIVRIIYIAPLGKGRVQLYLYILKFCIETAGHDEKICTVDQLYYLCIKSSVLVEQLVISVKQIYIFPPPAIRHCLLKQN